MQVHDSSASEKMNKTIIVTGASGGIGGATAKLAAADGYAVIVHYNTGAEAAGRVVDAIRAQGGRALGVCADIAKAAEVAALFDAAEKAFGPIGGLVCNAGISGRAAPFAEQDEASLRQVVETNLLGTMLCAQEGVRRMIPEKSGSIVLVSSTAAVGGGAGRYVPYAATKAAIETIAVGLAREVGAVGIRVNAVRPGVIDTPLNGFDENPGGRVRLEQAIPLGRVGRSEEVAAAILWLLSDRASYVTGAVLPVSGGR